MGCLRRYVLAFSQGVHPGMHKTAMILLHVGVVEFSFSNFIKSRRFPIISHFLLPLLHVVTAKKHGYVLKLMCISTIISANSGCVSTHGWVSRASGIAVCIWTYTILPNGCVATHWCLRNPASSISNTLTPIETGAFTCTGLAST